MCRDFLCMLGCLLLHRSRNGFRRKLSLLDFFYCFRLISFDVFLDLFHIGRRPRDIWANEAAKAFASIITLVASLENEIASSQQRPRRKSVAFNENNAPSMLNVSSPAPLPQSSSSGDAGNGNNGGSDSPSRSSSPPSAAAAESRRLTRPQSAHPASRQSSSRSATTNAGSFTSENNSNNNNNKENDQSVRLRRPMSATTRPSSSSAAATSSSKSNKSTSSSSSPSSSPRTRSPRPSSSSNAVSSSSASSSHAWEPQKFATAAKPGISYHATTAPTELSLSSSIAFPARNPSSQSTPYSMSLSSTPSSSAPPRRRTLASLQMSNTQALQANTQSANSSVVSDSAVLVSPLSSLMLRISPEAEQGKVASQQQRTMNGQSHLNESDLFGWSPK